MEPRTAATHPADLTLLEASVLLRGRDLTAVELLEACLERIDATNGGEPSFEGSAQSINAWARLYPERALAQARQADEQLQRHGRDASPLCGIPLAVKDLYALQDLPLTASSRVLEGNVAQETAAVAARLEQQGMVILGHTHTHEFAAGGSTDQVGNPWSLGYSAGGSSGGSAAALAAGMAPAALGTDTAGSVRIPASLCGVSAIKPGFDRVPLYGVIPLAPTLDHSGPMGRTLADCAAVLTEMMRAERPAIPWSSAPGQEPELLLQASTAARPLEGMRIALTGRHLERVADQDILDGLDLARLACEDLGAEIVDLPAPVDLDQADYDTILGAEARSYHHRHAHHEDRYRGSTRDFLAFGAEEMPVRRYLQAQERRLAVTRQWAHWFQVHSIDAVLEPTQAVTAPARGHGYDPDQQVGGQDPLTLFTALWNYTGFPVATLPTHLGRRSGLPVSVSLVSAPGREDRAIGIGVILQQHALPPLGLAPIAVGPGNGD